MGFFRRYKRKSEVILKVGDLVELSAYGRKILENRRYLKKLGMVSNIREYTKAGQTRISYTVSWFGASNPTRHPRLDLKIYKKEAK